VWIQNIVHEACPICGKETTLAVIEPHPTHQNNAPYISMCGLRGGQNNLRLTLACAAGLEAPKGTRLLRISQRGRARSWHGSQGNETPRVREVKWGVEDR
jgi:hypothetical protein